MRNRDIAIVGFAGRFPEAGNTDEFYRNLTQGRDSVRPVTLRRMQDTSISVQDNYKDVGFMEGIDLFDHKFFDLSMAEARNMPPHHRLLLEVVYGTFENAAYDLKKIRGRKGAVFIGNAMINYVDLAEKYDPTLLTGNLSSAIAGKVARFFDLRGGALMVDTACSSSLVALHYACNEIISGDAEFALACGMDLATFLPTKSIHDIGVNAPDGKAKSFSAAANGTGMGEAVACVMLKPLDKALEDQDTIHCVIKGSAVNQDAALSASASAPDSKAQAEVITAAWEKAEVEPESITFIEAHGTGTKIGDPIEIKGLNLAFRKFTQNRHFCAVASLKSNIGHAGSAAGIAGLIKVILSFKHKMIFPSLHCATTNPLIDFKDSAVYVNTQLRYWEGDERGVRRSGLSSFGISGTNCHVVLEEAPPVDKASVSSQDTSTQRHFIVPISAKSRHSLLKNIEALKKYLSEHPKEPFDSICNTLTIGRSHYRYRYCVTVLHKEGLLDCLTEEGMATKIDQKGQVSEKLIFTFSDGIDVSKALLHRFCDGHPAFKNAFSSVEELMDWENPNFRQFAFQYAFYHLLLEHGIETSLSIGDGVGKITSAFIREEISKTQAEVQLRNHVRGETLNLRDRLLKLVNNEASEEAVVFLEMGPEGSISAQLRALAQEEAMCSTVTIADEGEDLFLTYVQQLYLAGFSVNWEAFVVGSGRRSELPLYQFDTVRCWLREPSTVPDSNVEEWFYETRWRPDSKERSRFIEQDNIFLVVMDGQGLGEMLVKKLEQGGNTCITLVHGPQFEKVSALAYQIDFKNEGDHHRLAKDLFENGIDITGIIHLGEYGDFSALSIDNLGQQLGQGIYSKIHLTKVFADRLVDKKFHLVFVTSHAEQVLPDDTITSERSMSATFLKGLLAEYPRLKINSIDLTNQKVELEKHADHIMAELWQDELISFVCYRKGQRYLPHLTKIEIGKNTSSESDFMTESGVYILVGGAKGIGMALSTSIAKKNPDNTLILLGRTAIPDRELWEDSFKEGMEWNAGKIVDNIRALESCGASVEYYSVDVGDAVAMQSLLSHIAERYPQVDGIVHLAGISGSMLPFEQKPLSEIQKVLTPKVNGTLALNVWVKKLNPKFMALFSSLNALVPHKNTVGYTIANGFLDAFARSAPGHGTHYVSVNWPGWKEVGMSSGGTAADEPEEILKSINTEDGLKAFYLALKIKKPNLAVADADLSHFISNPYFIIDLEDRGVPQLTTSVIPEAVPMVEDVTVTETEKNILSFWYEILEADKIELDDDFFEIGGHSLNGTQLLNRIEKEFGVELEFEDVFEYPTVRKLSNYIDNQIGNDYIGRFEDIQPQPTQEFYEVTHSQRRLWIIDQMEEHQVAYNMTGAYQLADINYGALQNALFALVERHEILRTTFVLIDGELKQKVNAINTRDFAIEKIDLQSDPDRYARAKEIANRDAGTHFDLAEGPLLRMLLLQLTAHEYVLLFNMHHIISDAWSMDVLKDDLIALYESEYSGSKNPLPPLRIQYKDYAVWQNRELDSSSSKRHEVYWLDKFSGQLSPLNLPTDLPRTQNKTFSGSHCGYLLNEAASEGLANIAKENGASMFMVVSATVYTLLYRYTQCADITLGTPIANRNHSDLENQIGFYVNTLALRLQMEGDQGFLEILEKVKRNTLEAYEHQVFPFDKLVDLLDLDRDMSRTPLFDVNLVYQTSSTAGYFEGKEPGLVDNFKDGFSADPKTSIFDITLDFTWDGSHLLLIAKYNTDIFFRSTIERLLMNYQTLVLSICDFPTKAIHALDLLDKEEKKELLPEKSSTQRLTSLVDLWEYQARESADKVALLYRNEDFTYATLEREADSLALFLGSQGIGQGDMVALLMDNSPYSLTAVLGVLKAGASFLPLDPKNHLERLKFIIEDSETSLLIFHSDYLRSANSLLWESHSLKSYLCIDQEDVMSISEESNQLMNQELWDYIGETAQDGIAAGGWVSSYTGLPFSVAEMEEYKENTFQKLRPYLNKACRVLEIGCASGITMKAVAPEVGYYLATDMSRSVLGFAQKEAEIANLGNVQFKHLAAHELHLIGEDRFDIIIINSVVQSFPGINYLYEVIGKTLDFLGDRGIVFLGDLQDLDKKSALITDLLSSKEQAKEQSHKVKTDWSNELFLSRKFLEDLTFEFPALFSVSHSDKLGEIKNELTEFRFDCILEKDIYRQSNRKGIRNKHCFDQSSLSDMNRSAVSLRPLIHAESTAYVIYTSGTTGQPKGVEVTHSNLAHYVTHANSHYFNNEADFCMALFTPLFFDLTITSIFCPLLRGDKIVIDDSKDIARTLEEIFSPESIVKAVKLTPSHITVLADLNVTKTNVSLVISGGEALLPHHVQLLFDLNPAIRLFNEYGPTETTVGVTIKEIMASDDFISIGRATEGHSTYILDEKLNLLPRGVAGELYIAGVGVAKGYLKKEELTRQKFLMNPFSAIDGFERIYRTGDIVKWNSAGELELLGRADHQVKIRGYRVEVAAVEKVLASMARLDEAAVVVKQDSEGEKYLAGYFVAQETVDVKDLKQSLQEVLPAYMVPDELTQLDQFVLNRNGKVDRKHLKHFSYVKEAFQDTSHMDALEKQLLEIWQGLLERNPIGLDDDFFEIGGHSLKATRLMAHIFKVFQIKIDLRAVFAHPTIRQLAKLIKNGKKEQNDLIQVQEARAHYDITNAQKRIWLLSQVDPGLTAYNMPISFLMEGILDFEAFEKALKTVVDRHEILRTTIVTVEGEPKQMVHSLDTIASPLLAITDIRREGRDLKAKAKDMALKFSNELIPLEEVPLFRALFIRIEDNLQLFAFSIHHIIADGWSMGIIINEMTLLYNAYVNGKEAILPPLNIQYKDYTYWLNEQLSGEGLDRMKGFWSRQLKGEIPKVQFPSTIQRPEVKTYNGERKTLLVDGELSRFLDRFTQRNKCTTYMTLLASIKIVIYKYTGQSDIIVGTPVSGRGHVDLESQVGLYLNTVPIRTQLDAKETLKALFGRFRQNVLSSLEHQLYPFDNIVEDLQLVWERNRSVLFDVGFNLSNEGNLKENRFHGLKAVRVDSGFRSVKTDLWFNAEEQEEGLSIALDYNRDIFHPAFIDEFLANLAIVFSNLDEGLQLDQMISLINEQEEKGKKEKQYQLRRQNLSTLKNIK